jgi:hypothetical protein
MKLFLLIFPTLLCGFRMVSVGQKNIQFIYIGSEKEGHECVLITSTDLGGRYSESKEPQFKKEYYYTDQRTIDTLKSYISRSNYITQLSASEIANAEIDTHKLVDAYKIIGIDKYTFFVKGNDCLKLFLSTMRYLDQVGLSKTSARYAMTQLLFQCHQELWRRELDSGPSDTIEDPYHILRARTP